MTHFIPAFIMQGRVGDSPLIGYGCYAGDLSAGASATGWGESIMKVVLCKAVCDYTTPGYGAQAAAEKWRAPGQGMIRLWRVSIALGE